MTIDYGTRFKSTPEMEAFPGTHALPAEREAELRAHLKQCELPFLACSDCAELFEHLGYREYARLVEEAGETESENYL